MEITKRIGNLVNDLDLIVRKNCGAGSTDNLFRNPDTSEESIRSTMLTGTIEVGNALVDIIEELENRYGISFEQLEKNRQ